jgi:Domain of unknown function (DUF4279)
MSDNHSRATLAITSSILTAKNITEILQIEPSKFHEKDSLINTRNPHKGLRDKSSWLLHSKLSRESDIQEKIEEFSSIVENNLMAFQTIKDRVEIEIYCSFFLEKESDVFSLSSKIISKLSLIPIDIIVAVYPYNYSGGD